MRQRCCRVLNTSVRRVFCARGAPECIHAMLEGRPSALPLPHVPPEPCLGQLSTGSLYGARLEDRLAREQTGSSRPEVLGPYRSYFLSR